MKTIRLSFEVPATAAGASFYAGMVERAVGSWLGDFDFAVKADEDYDELRRIGDVLQSEASRLADWCSVAHREGAIWMPYEEQMAVVGVLDAVTEWTAIRRKQRA